MVTLSLLAQRYLAERVSDKVPEVLHVLEGNVPAIMNTGDGFKANSCRDDGVKRSYSGMKPVSSMPSDLAWSWSVSGKFKIPSITTWR